ncbi:hypothetical protein BLNAU_4094 [Blattamonas nauphoetae]|uniref:Protein kinase domain-containing protein n=1 Tax=Blattamonas nauphoetae TaxID=2049346 RepID=A0ABQ9YB56_9EUKA|nr:hypothetical protein BLNAU_4094 [Blattamonas nauphoetae]
MCKENMYGIYLAAKVINNSAVALAEYHTASKIKACKITNPFILEVHSCMVNTQGDQHVLFLEYADQGNLSDIIKANENGGVPEYLAKRVLYMLRSNSLIGLTGAASVTLDTIDFSGMTTEGSGSVIYSTSTGTIALSSVSFSSCNCGASQKGRSVFIERSFVANSVSMTSVLISSSGTVGFHDIFLKGSNITSTITQTWESLIGADDTLTSAVMERVVGEKEGSAAKSGPVAYLLYPHTEGCMFVDGSFWDHESCGKEKLPCRTFEHVHSKLNASNQKIVFSTSYTLTGEVNSLPLGSVLTTKLSQTVSTDPTTQFVVQAGPLSFEDINIALPTTITKPLFVVKACVLSITSSVTIQNAPSASTHQASLVSLSSGTLQMTGTELIFQPTFVSTESLIVQTAGNLELTGVTVQHVSKSTGDGSVLHSTLSSTTDQIQISGTSSFKDCHSSVGIEGALFISCPQSYRPSSLVVDATFADCSCGPDMKGEWTGTIAGLTWDSPDHLWGTDSNEADHSVYRSISLLVYFIPYRHQVIHVGAGGRNMDGCGSSTWKYLTLNQAQTHLSGSTPYTLSIDSETLVLDGSSLVRSSSLLTLSQTGSLDINHCTFSTFTLTDSALIEHTGSILSLSGGSFKGNTRRQGEGAVLAPSITNDMEVHVNGITLDTLTSETGFASDS